MNKLLLTSILFLAFLTSRSQTSVYHPFPDSDAVWNVQMNYFDFCLSAAFSAYQDYSYIMPGDTIIGTETYHKLQIPAYENWHFNPCYSSSITPGNYAGCIRQDTSVRKVYFIPPTDSIEQLLYDFSLQVGDTLRGYLTPNDCQPGSDYQKVTGVDSIFIDSNYRKIWDINGGYRQIIEGIGTTRGLLEIACDYVGTPWFDLMCFKQNETTLYPSSSSCDIITINSNLSIAEPILIFPNPVHDFITINHPGQLEVYNSLGEKVYEAIVNLKPQTLNPKLPAGIYFVNLTDGDKLYRSKLIIN